MIKKPKINMLLNSKIVVALVVPLMFLLGIIQVAQGFIDTHNYRDGIVKIIRDQTGREVTIKGNVSISLLPSPTIYIPGVELRDPESEEPAPAATVDMIRLSVPLMSVFSDHPLVYGIRLQHPVLELVRAHDNRIHWEWLNAGLLKALAGKHEGQHSLFVEIEDGKILYHDNRNDQGTTIENIDANGTNIGGALDAKSSFSAYGHTMKLALHTGAAAPVTPANPNLESLYAGVKADDGLSVELKGSMDMSGDVPKINGTLDTDIQNMMVWVKTRGDEKNPVLDQVSGANASKAQPQEALPLKLQGEWSEVGSNVNLTKVTLDGMHSTGTGTLGLTWNDWRPAITADLHFADFDYLQWKTLALTLLDTRRGAAARSSYHGPDTQPVNPLPPDMQASVHIAADKLLIGPQIWQTATLSADLSDAAITVNGFHVNLPGDATLTLFGIISQGSTSGLRYEGSMETSGKSLRQALTVFDSSASELPETGFGAFSARSNIFISAEQMRLSEADVKISDLHLNGGMVAYFDARPRLEADVKLKDINFDYFRDVWRDRQKKTGPQNSLFAIDNTGMSFGWLKKLQTNIDLKVNVDGFHFLEKQGDSASFRIFVKQGEFGIYDIHFNYPGSTTEASFNLNVTGEQPYINLTLNTNDLNTNYFSANPNAPVTVLPEKAEAPATDDNTQGDTISNAWSKKLFDMSWMAGYGGSFDISIGKLTHGPLILDRVKLQAKLDQNLLNLESFNFIYWQGRCSMLGSLYGGKVPGVSLSFTLYDAELHDLLKTLIDRENITGKVSISGTLTTSGVNPLSWVSQSDSKLVLAGRGVHVDGVNLQGVVDAVSVSRTAADVFNNVNLALVNGASDFQVDGNLNVRAGVLRTPGVTLRTGAITGDLTGEVKLVPWTMELSTLFQFPAVTSETIPTMTVQLAGPVGSASLRTDTASLEAYVAKRIVSK